MHCKFGYKNVLLRNRIVGIPQIFLKGCEKFSKFSKWEHIYFISNLIFDRPSLRFSIMAQQLSSLKSDIHSNF